MLRLGDGLIVEIDSEEFHAKAFERDHSRQSTYDALGYHWVTLVGGGRNWAEMTGCGPAELKCGSYKAKCGPAEPKCGPGGARTT